MPVALQADRKVKVVVGGVGIVRRRLHKQHRPVVALAAGCHALVIHYLGQRQNLGHFGKGLLGLGIIA